MTDTKEHNIVFSPKGHQIEVVCSCGTVIPATNGTDAIRVARNHIIVERMKEDSQIH